MRKVFLLAAAASMAAAMPALAKPDKGQGHGAHAAKPVHAKGAVRTTHRVTRLDRNGNGIPDSRERRADGNRYGANGCPPGLARKNNGCLPPGQAKRLFSQGQRIPAGYRYFSAYNDIPLAYRSRVPFNDGYRYIYRNHTVYVVNPRTRLVTSIIDLIL